MGQEVSTPVDAGTPTQTLDARTVEAVASYIKAGRAQKIVVMVGHVTDEILKLIVTDNAQDWSWDQHRCWHPRLPFSRNRIIRQSCETQPAVSPGRFWSVFGMNLQRVRTY